MHPIELLRKLQWSYQRLAITFGVSETEARRWASRGKTTRRNPSRTAMILAAVIDHHPEVLVTIKDLDF